MKFRDHVIAPSSARSLFNLRRSSAEVLAYVLKALFPNVIMIGGEASAIGFHYDVVLEQAIDNQIIPLIEEYMRGVIKEKIPVRSLSMMRENAIEFFLHHHQPLKAQIVATFPENIVDLIQIEDFYDTCPAPHIANSDEIGAFKILQIEKRMNQSYPGIGFQHVFRIRGTAFVDLQSLKKFLKKAEQAKKRDHRVLGREMQLFDTHEMLGKGCWIWHPKGVILRELLVGIWRKAIENQRFNLVSTPSLLQSELLRKVGFYESSTLANTLFPSLPLEDVQHYLTPNHVFLHALLFQMRPRLFDELPIKYAEMAEIYQNEKEGNLWGLFQSRYEVRDIETTFCHEKQVLEELISSLQFINRIITMLRFEHCWYLSSSRPKKSLSSVEKWTQSIEWLVEALKISGLNYTVDQESVETYGPRVEVRLIDALGREWEGPSLGFDLHHPKSFALRYQSAENQVQEPVMMSRSVFGSLDRFIAVLVEHCAGQFPLWLTPEQVRVIPLGEAQRNYASCVRAQLENGGFRVGIDCRMDRLAVKIQAAMQEKVPYIVILGEKEERKQLISVRSFESGATKSGLSLESFLEELNQEIKAQTFDIQMEINNYHSTHRIKGDRKTD